MRSALDPWRRWAADAIATGTGSSVEVEHDGRVYSFMIAPVADAGYVNLYGRNITGRKQAEEKLLNYQKQLQSLASELSLTEERERRQVATVLHDRIGQTLAVSKIKLAAVREELSGSDHSGPVGEILELIEQTIQDTRSLTLELSPPILYELGLEAALQWLAEEFQRRHGIPCELEDDAVDKPLDDDIRVVLFQSVRELLLNVAKHARAGLVRIVVAREEDHITLSVQDDGIGFDTDETGSRPRNTGGFGLFNIRERLEHLGGCLDLHSETGKGTSITLTAPLTRQHDQEHAP